MGGPVGRRRWEQLPCPLSGLGTALPSQDRDKEGHARVAQGTQFEGRTSVGCGVEELHFKGNLERFLFFN